MNRVQSVAGRGAGVVALACVAAACSAVVLAGCGSGSHRPAAKATTTQASTGNGLDGLVPTPLPRKPDFSLTDTSGRAYSFDAATRGKLTYLFFGYTHCPDACPATMSYLAYAIHSQPAAVRRDVAVVFVTVDPRRDSGPVIRRWLNHYSRDFVGLRGTPAQIALIERQAGVPVATDVPASSGVANYQVEHSSFLFAYSPDGFSHVLYAQGFKPADYAHDMPLLLRFR